MTPLERSGLVTRLACGHGGRGAKQYELHFDNTFGPNSGQNSKAKRAALKFMRNLLKKQGYIPDAIVIVKLGSYSATRRELGLSHLHVTDG